MLESSGISTMSADTNAIDQKSSSHSGRRTPGRGCLVERRGSRHHIRPCGRRNPQRADSSLCERCGTRFGIDERAKPQVVGREGIEPSTRGL